MSTIFYVSLAGALIILVGVGSTVVASYLNRHLISIEKMAKSRVRGRLSQRDSLPIEKFIDSLEIGDESKPQAKLFLEGIAKILGVSAEFLRPNDRLSDLIRVRFEDVNIESKQVWRKTKLGDHIDVQVYDILDILEKMVSRKEWKSIWEKIPLKKNKKKEEVWIEYILTMNLGEIIQIFIARRDMP
jgi:hypothetical protein